MDYRHAKLFEKALYIAWKEHEFKKELELDEYSKTIPKKPPTEAQMKQFRKKMDEEFGKIKTPPSPIRRTMKRAVLIAAIAVIIMAVITAVVIATRLGSKPYIFKETTSEGQAIWMTQDPTQEDFEHGSRLN